MCRHLAYLGPPVTLHDLLLAPVHSLLRQSWEARHQDRMPLNADGFGVGWYDLARRPEPARYRDPRPIWTDRSFASLAGLTASSSILAAVRAASPGLPIEESGNAPFTNGPWLFSHNGTVDRFLEGVGVELRRLVSDTRLGIIEGASDSEVLFALLLDRLDAGATTAEGLAHLIDVVCERTTGRLNFLLTNGTAITATTFGNSLYVRRGADYVVVASEPYDDEPNWESVPDKSVVEATVESVAVRPLSAA
jgi:glutamine amidotransferase